MQIFTTLEENNLLEIERMKDSDDELELLKQQKKQREQDFKDQIETLEATDARDKKRIHDSEMERNALQDVTEGDESQNIEEHTYNQI